MYKGDLAMLGNSSFNQINNNQFNSASNIPSGFPSLGQDVHFLLHCDIS